MPTTALHGGVIPKKAADMIIDKVAHRGKSRCARHWRKKDYKCNLTVIGEREPAEVSDVEG